MDPTVVQLILQDRKIAYALTDRNLRVIEVSGAVTTFSNSHTTWLGQPLLDLVPELVGSEAVLADILAGQAPRFQLSLVNRESPAGQTLYLTMVQLPYRDRDGQITGLVHLVDDVTDLGQLEQQLTQQRNELRLLRDKLSHQNLELAAANAELRRLDDIKSAFVSVAAHELRTPLSSIRGFLEILLDDDADTLTTGQREYLHIVQSSADRLLNITNNLLDVTRIEAGRIDLIMQVANLAELLEMVAAELRPHITAKAQRLILRTEPELPAVLCDKTRTIQIIGNLLSNASKYTPRGGLITVSLAQAADQGFLELAVEDNGVGISAEDQAKLFARFFRAATATKTGASGTGLGLHITRSLVELHGGRIWFESEPDQGSVFHVTFPIAEDPAV